MRIFLITRKQMFQMLGWLGVALIIGWAWYLGSQYYHCSMAGKYLVRRDYPPLVILPSGRSGPAVCASAAVLIELRSGAVLYAKNPELRRAPASTTKIMTAIVALEKGNLRQVVRVSRRAAATGGSTLCLKAGDRLTLKELLEGVILRSGNDGSVAVAEGVAGDIANFVRLMNLKAKEIGALNTNFQNPHGLRAPSHYTTALDLALLARYALGDRRFARLVKTKTATLEWLGGGKRVAIRNTNRLLWSMQGVDGVKTGTTNEAGHCLVASATRDGKRLIAVVLHSGNRWRDCAQLLEYGFQNFSIIKIATPAKPAGRVRLSDGPRSFLSLYPRRELIAVVPRGTEDALRIERVIFQDPVKEPLAAGRCLGKISYRYRGQLVEGVDLINHAAAPWRWRWW
jgi:D-alanyl-D-alanine carboxypeptidase (penicillin-binding protein 5/6)